MSEQEELEVKRPVFCVVRKQDKERVVVSGCTNLEKIFSAQKAQDSVLSGTVV